MTTAEPTRAGTPAEPTRAGTPAMPAWSRRPADLASALAADLVGRIAP